MTLFWTHSLWLTLQPVDCSVGGRPCGSWTVKRGAAGTLCLKKSSVALDCKTLVSQSCKGKEKKNFYIFCCLKTITVIMHWLGFFLKGLYFQWLAQGTHPNTAEGRKCNFSGCEDKRVLWVQTFFRSFNTCSSMPSSANRSRTPSITSSITDW